MTTTEENDEILIGRYARGDAAAFDHLYRRHELRVWCYLERNVSDQATSDELLQEIWLALARNAVSLESVTRFRTRLFTLAHDRMVQSRRERAAKGMPAPARPAAADDPANTLARAIGQLSAEERETFLLHLEGQLSIGEIAEITESPSDAVDSRLALARSQMAPSPDQVGEVDQVYRRLSGLDAGRPGEWVRRKVQAYAAQQAAERAIRESAKGKETSTSAAPTPRAAAPIPAVAEQSTKKPWLLPLVFGGIAVAAVAGFLVVPRMMGPGAAVSPAPVPAQQSPSLPQPDASPSPVAQEPSAVPSSAESESESPEATSTSAQSSEPAASPAVSSTNAPATSPAAASHAPGTVSPSLAQTPGGQRPPAASASGTASPPTPSRSAASAAANTAKSSSASSSAVQPTPRTRVSRQNSPSAQTAAPGNAHTDSAAQSAQVAQSANATDSTPGPRANVETQSAPASVPTPPSAPPARVAAAGAASSADLDTPDQLWTSAKNGDMAGLQAEFASNADLNALSPKGESPLILAIQNSRVEAVKALLSHGANPNTPDATGRTPIRAARVRNNYAILQALQRNGR